MPILENLFLFVEQIALALMLVYAYSTASRHGWHPRIVNLAMGAIFGACSISAMLQPIELAPGIIIDIRSLFVGMAAALFGFVSGLVALVLAASARLALGGDGAIAGVVGVILAAAAGLCWGKLVRPRVPKDDIAFIMLGVIISFHMLGVVMLPRALQIMFFQNIAPVLFIANLVGAYFLAKLISRERGFFAEQKQLQTAARYDPLTGLLNRDAAVSDYQKTRGRPQTTLGEAMICIDVVHFKQINDQHGHL